MKKLFYISLTVLITIGIVLLGIFVFNTSYTRFGESLSDLWLSAKYYFCYFFNLENTDMPTVTQYSKIFTWEPFLPKDLETFKNELQKYFRMLVSAGNMREYVGVLGVNLGNIAKIISVTLPVLLLLFFVLKRIYETPNMNHGKDTLPLAVYKKIVSVTYIPAKRVIGGYICYLKGHSWFFKIWLTMWVFHLNFATIIAAFLAYYFYFAASFDISNLYVQIVKFFFDLQVLFRHTPIWVYLIVAYFVFCAFRKRIARRRLQHFEARNCGFIKELPIVSMSCGSMGKKKTTLITDMALSQEVMFRQKAFEIIQKCDMKFPYFPWICFETELRKCMEYGTVYNLATIKKWVKLKEERFNKHKNADRQLYGYDYEKYGFRFNDALRITDLFDVLTTYAQSYFIYVIESSLIVSNYSIRTDSVLADEGNFPLWINNFFPETAEQDSRFSHILDFDVLRLGKKVIENNPNNGSFEFGVVLITEVGKERGNNLELKEVKKGTDETNQKNDLFNAWLKMCRHSATVDNFPFIKVFTDEQRPESWGADARDLCDVIHIVSSGETKLAMPFYTIEDMLSEWAFNGFIGLYYDFRFRRGDNTLLVHILKALTSFIWRRNMRIYNKYGYSILRIEKERGTMDGKIEKKRYFFMSRKIYSRRFSTDCFSDYFNELAKNTKVGLADYHEYATEKATVEELKLQNSYFINSLYK